MPLPECLLARENLEPLPFSSSPGSQHELVFSSICSLRLVSLWAGVPWP